MLSYRLSRGFTLIELLVVIAIISLLSSIVLASLSQARAKAKAVKAATEMRAIAQAATRYYLDTGVPPPKDTYSWLEGDENKCARAIFVTGNFKYETWDGTVWQEQARPAGWDGPYLSVFPNTPWGKQYNWDYQGDEDDGGGGNEDCAIGNRYVIGLSAPANSQNFKELRMLHDLLDDDAKIWNGNGSGLADISGPNNGVYSFRYRPFRVQDPDTRAGYEETINGPYFDWLPNQPPDTCSCNPSCGVGNLSPKIKKWWGGSEIGYYCDTL